jgi:hypothetical protein
MRDVLTVGFGEPAALPAAGVPRPSASRLRHALRVAAQSFRLQLDVEARGDAARTGAPAHAEWRPAPVSPRAAELRDLVLARCGTLGR